MSKKALNVQDDSRRKGIQGNTSKSEIKCVCLNARSIINKKTELNIMVDDIKPHIIQIYIYTIVDKYRKLLKKTKEARVEQIILSGILPVFGNRIDGYRNSKRMAINGMVKRLCKEEDVGYVDLWDSVVGKEGMYARDGLHLSGKGAAVFAEGLSGAVASGLGKVRYLN